MFSDPIKLVHPRKATLEPMVLSEGGLETSRHYRLHRHGNNFER